MTLLAPTRYDEVVKAFGGWGERVTSPRDPPALERGIGDRGLRQRDVDPQAPATSGRWHAV